MLNYKFCSFFGRIFFLTTLVAFLVINIRLLTADFTDGFKGDFTDDLTNFVGISCKIFFMLFAKSSTFESIISIGKSLLKLVEIFGLLHRYETGVDFAFCGSLCHTFFWRSLKTFFDFGPCFDLPFLLGTLFSSVSVSFPSSWSW